MNEDPRMTDEEFLIARERTRMNPDSATSKAAKMVLVDGTSTTAAASALHISDSAVSRGVSRLRKEFPVRVCPNCGHRF